MIKLTSLVTIKPLKEDSSVEQEIRYYTGTRLEAVAEFLKKYNIDGTKLAKYIRKGDANARSEFISALVGKPGNKIQKMIIQKFGK